MTLCLSVKEREEFQSLHEMFRLLATGERTVASPHDMIDTTYYGCVSLVCVAEPRYIEKIDVVEAEDEIEIRWVQSAEQWDDCCGLLEGLLVGTGPGGHQYLAGDGRADIVATVSSKRPPTW